MLRVIRLSFRYLEIAACLARPILLSLVVSAAGVAQTDPAAGILPFSSQKFGVDLARGSINLVVPMRSKLGKIPFSTSMQNTFSVWNNSGKWAANANNMSNFYPQFLFWGAGKIVCPNGSLSQLYIMDAFGTRHAVIGSLPCGSTSRNLTSATTDGSGYTLVIRGSSATIYDSSGSASTGGIAGFTPWKLSDPDGTTVQFNNVMGGSGTYTDSLNQTALTVTYRGPNSYDFDYTYTDLGGNTQKYSVQTTVYNFVTAFGCPGITDGNSSNWFQFPTSIAAPFGNYSISYEQTGPGNTTGRVASITYPSGGSLSYGYSGGNNGINCSSGVVPLLTVTRNDNNGHSDKWTYVNSNSSSIPGNFTVTETDPANNQTVYYFAGEYQTQTLAYEGGCPTSINGCNGGGTLQRTTTTCYNGHFSSCATPSAVPTLPISQTDVYMSLNGSSSGLTETKYDTYGNTTEVKRYDYGAAVPPTGNPLSDTTITYAGVNGVSCGSVGPYQYDRACSITTLNPSGTSMVQVSQVNYTYTIGHPTQTSTWVTGSNSLNSSASYNTNGTVNTATDVGGNVSTYAYNGTDGCNGLLPTSVTKSGLTTATQWNCNGGVVTQTTDANGQPTNYAYNDPLWRRTSITDPLDTVTTYSYPTPTTFESVMNVNGSVSTSDTLITTDGLGRQILTQTRQGRGASMFDTVQTTYGWSGNYRTLASSQPCSTTSGSGCTTVHTNYLDPLGRLYQETTTYNEELTHTYTQNDDLSVLSFPPAGENNKQVQTQYDGLGRPTSSCAISSTVSGNVSCGQNTNTSATGVVTTTKYTSTAGSQTVSSTRGSQTRSQTYDALGRITSSTMPEGGTTTYVYDTYQGVNEPGQLMMATFANGNNISYAYDSLGRISAEAAYNATFTVGICREFFYDNSTGATGTIPSGITISNPYGRMVEAETDNCTNPITNITDEWFSYDKDGHVTDMWELTPHSGTYYHSHATIAGNGAPLTVQLANPSLYTETYGLDGEGRPATLSSSGTTLVAGTAYNASSQPTYIDLGTGTDQSDYGWDPNTGRMKNWTFQVGNTSETGTLTWNANGTLRQLAIVDGFNSGGSQTCTFGTSTVMGYDDLGRLLTDNCGSVWQQTFSYNDQYDNLTKSGSSSWNPGYNPANNHYSTGANYDNSGNVTSDPSHTYSWDGYNKLSSIDSSSCASNGECITYDAFGRIVETSYNGVYTEIWYTQLGKTVYMHGSTPQYAYWPTPGGGTVEVNGNNVTSYYMHKDWLGNSRVSSVIGNSQVVSDQAYAPYGEVYNLTYARHLS